AARRPRRERAQRDDDLRHVRRERRVGLRGGAAGEERRRRRRARRAARPARDRRLLATPRRARQQRARDRGLQGPLARVPAALPARAGLGPLGAARAVLARARRLEAAGPVEREALDRRAERAQVYEMQGDLGFAAAESLVRRIVAASPELE